MRQFLKQNLSKNLNPHQSSPPTQSNKPTKQTSLPPPTTLEIFQYRYHHGVNLGSIFVLEKWLFKSAFPTTCATQEKQSSELECVKAWVKEIGTEATRLKFEERWRACVGDGEWCWLRDEARCTTIRLPIGYFTLGPEFCVGTPFEEYAPVYAHAWQCVKDIVAQARSYGIGVLIDFHALPGGANKGDHSGTNSGTASLWNNPKNLAHALKCLVYIAQEINADASLKEGGVVGIQLCNEADWNAHGLYEWYDDVIAAISLIDSTIPIYISDAWDLNRAITYAQKKNKIASRDEKMTNPIVIDTHVYFCFSHHDKSPRQIVSSFVPKVLDELNGKEGNVVEKGAVQVVVGEYSCTLSGQSWSKIDDQRENRKELTTLFAKEQCKVLQHRAGGSYFWTLKMDWMDGGDWGFVEQTSSGNINAPGSLLMAAAEVKAAISKAQRERESRGQQRCGDHVRYWHRTAPGKPFEHWRYEHGWYSGWDDALAFFSLRVNGGLEGFVSGGGDKVGCLDLWVRKRVGESGMDGSFTWEYETGFRKGIHDFYDCAGV